MLRKQGIKKDAFISADFSDDISDSPMIVSTKDTGTGVIMTLKVYQMPKTKEEMPLFNKYMKLFGANQKQMLKMGYEREKERTKLKKNPNCLLFAIQNRVGNP
jgi:hypothetical protein